MKYVLFADHKKKNKKTIKQKAKKNPNHFISDFMTILFQGSLWYFFMI